jgi:hypothetical protein
MKRALAVAFMTALIAPVSVRAASLHITQHGNSTFSIYLDGESLNNGFNAMSFRVTPGGDFHVRLVNGLTTVADFRFVPFLDHPLAEYWSPSRPFGNVDSGSVAGIARPPGQPFTYRNRLMNADPLDQPDTLGWTLLDIVVQPNEIELAGGPLGRRITTADQPNGRLFLANLHFVIPEPAAAALASIDVLLPMTTRRISRHTRWQSKSSRPPTA